MPRYLHLNKVSKSKVFPEADKVALNTQLILREHAASALSSNLLYLLRLALARRDGLVELTLMSVCLPRSSAVLTTNRDRRRVIRLIKIKT